MDIAANSRSLPRMQARLTLTVHLSIGKCLATLAVILLCLILVPGKPARLSVDPTIWPLPLHSLKSAAPPEWKDWDSYFKRPGQLPFSW